MLFAVFNPAAIENGLGGGLAMAFHGCSRFTKEVDILIAHGTLEHALLDRKDWLDLQMLGFEP